MNFFDKNDFEDKNLLEFKYSKEDHLQNLLLFGQIVSNVKKNFEYEDLTIDVFYTRIKDLYFLIEKYIESGIIDIVLTVKKLITNCYSFMINKYDYKFYQLSNELTNIYDIKNSDYNNSSEFQLMYSGVYSFKTTIEHKILRLRSFYDGQKIKVSDEKMKDTVMDLINYCYIYLIWASKEFPQIRKIKISVEQ
ncbi:MAG: nucleotide modification associated domain-containing protein [Bacillota bacterium]